MNTFTLTIATPDGNRFHGEAEGLFVRGTEGDLAVLAGHTPFFTAIRPGVCSVDTPDGERRTGHTDGGLLSVGTDRVTLLSDSFRWDES